MVWTRVAGTEHWGSNHSSLPQGWARRTLGHAAQPAARSAVCVLHCFGVQVDWAWKCFGHGLVSNYRDGQFRKELDNVGVVRSQRNIS